MTDSRYDLKRDIDDLCPEVDAAEIELDEGTELSFAAEDVDDALPQAEPEMEGVPPVRVRFTAPVKIQAKGGAAVVDGVTLNISSRGLAFCAPMHVKPGEQVWARFRLNLADEEQRFRCQIVWLTPAGDGDTTYGVRFVDIASAAQDQVRAFVAERSQGRSADWPLPMMPEGRAPAAHGASPWMTAAAGMAAGIALALVLAMVPSRGVTQTPAAVMSMPSAPPLPAAPVLPATPSVVVDPNEIQKVEPPAEPAPVAAPIALAPEPVVVAERASAAPKPTPAKSTKLPAKKVSAAAKGDVLRPIGTKDSVQVGLVTDGQVAGHVSFWLERPRRLVVDVYGRKSGFAKSSYDIDHPLATHMRVGQHKDKVRFVIDTAEGVTEQVKARVVGKTLMVEIRRK